MAFLVVAGITLPVVVGAEESEPTRVGQVSRSFNGAARSSVRAEKYKGTFEIRFVTASDEATFRAAVALAAFVTCVIAGVTKTCWVTINRSGYRKLNTTTVTRTTSITLEEV